MVDSDGNFNNATLNGLPASSRCHFKWAAGVISMPDFDPDDPGVSAMWGMAQMLALLVMVYAVS